MMIAQKLTRRSTGRLVCQVHGGLCTRTMIAPSLQHDMAGPARAMPCRAMLSSTTARTNLLGHSPMAPSSSPASSNSANMGAIPTEQDVTTAGGVWAPTSSKRDKLAELQAEKGPNVASLDDLATPWQQRDLHLTDGLAAIFQSVDQQHHDLGGGGDDDAAASFPNVILQELHTWLQQQQQATWPAALHAEQFEEVLRDVVQHVDHVLTAQLGPAERHLAAVRDFMDWHTTPHGPTTATAPTTIPLAALQNDTVLAHYAAAVVRTRMLLVQAAATQLQASWQTLITMTDADVDRAATAMPGVVSVEPLVPTTTTTIPTHLMVAVLQTHLFGSCHDRVDAAWQLFDHRDQDGRLEQAEMNAVAEFTVATTRTALEQLFGQAVQAPQPLLTLDDEAALAAMPRKNNNKMGWRQQRRERLAQTRLLRLFRTTLRRHFLVEVELPHRLRCIYAWANKQHQNNSIESVHVDDNSGGGSSSSSSSSSWTGKQRYVELPPKIALPEFREVQKVHSKHLDRIGGEFLSSFRNDLWVRQGQGRQHAELRRDCFLFLLGVAVVDFGIQLL